MKTDPYCQRRNIAHKMYFSAMLSSASGRQTTLRWQNKSSYTHVRLSRAYLALARLSCFNIGCLMQYSLCCVFRRSVSVGGPGLPRAAVCRSVNVASERSRRKLPSVISQTSSNTSTLARFLPNLFHRSGQALIYEIQIERIFILFYVYCFRRCLSVYRARYNVWLFICFVLHAAFCT